MSAVVREKHFCDEPGCAKGPGRRFGGFTSLQGLAQHKRTHAGSSPGGRKTGGRPQWSQQSTSQDTDTEMPDADNDDDDQGPSEEDPKVLDEPEAATDSDQDFIGEEEEEEGGEYGCVVAPASMAESIQQMWEHGEPKGGTESRQCWADRHLCRPTFPDEAAEMRWDLEDGALGHCEQWYGETREQHYNDDTERLLQVAHAPA